VLNSVLGPFINNVLSEGVKKTNESFNSRLVSTFTVFVLGDLSESSHDSSEFGGHLKGDSVLKEFTGSVGDFKEGTTFSKLSSKIDGIVNGVDGVVVADSVLVVGCGFVSDDVVDDDKMLSVLDEVI